ncbi:EscU/YscU/HrcU family type III secretion system export apparatus switch protein, partial [Enterobacter hormaechei]|uniref:EscU/YscU/HrcU family type III secretion system export apparatus switch protein n=1 Tax=Enterobacter hormaechei TaxID=158836 RepID=UPI0039A2FFDD
MLIRARTPMVAFAVFYQLGRNLKKLRMNRQEKKDKFKTQEGAPQFRGRVRQIQRKMAKSRMMAEVPTAD